MTFNYIENFVAPKEIIPSELFQIKNFEKITDSINIHGLEPQTELDLLEDTDDSIDSYELIENRDNNFYNLKAANQFIFNAEKYNVDMLQFESKERHKYIISMPTKPTLKRYNSFHITVKLTKTQKTYSENIMAKLLSEDFQFDKSFFHISEDATIIKLTKKNKETNSYNVRIKIYYDNVVVEDECIDLYQRAKKCISTSRF